MQESLKVSLSEVIKQLELIKHDANNLAAIYTARLQQSYDKSKEKLDEYRNVIEAYKSQMEAFCESTKDFETGSCVSNNILSFTSLTKKV